MSPASKRSGFGIGTTRFNSSCSPSFEQVIASAGGGATPSPANREPLASVSLLSLSRSHRRVFPQIGRLVPAVRQCPAAAQAPLFGSADLVAARGFGSVQGVIGMVEAGRETLRSRPRVRRVIQSCGESMMRDRAAPIVVRE
jgi:hypothetical protein